MEIKETIGIDVTIYSTQAYSKFENTPKGFRSMLKWAKKNNRFTDPETVFLFEHTGIYSFKLACFFKE